MRLTSCRSADRDAHGTDEAGLSGGLSPLLKPRHEMLTYLIALAETRHFHRASEHVGITQPTLSAQIKAFEQKLGVLLLERSRSRVILTAAGEEIVAIARRVVRDVQEMRTVAK